MHGEVRTAERITPAMVRVVLGGDGLAGFEMPEATDAYVNVAIPPADASYGPVFDPDELRDRMDRDELPARRRYTVRRWDPDQRLLTLDFVVHGDEGVAGPWATGCAPGDVLVLTGPSGGYRPDPGADWHLLVGDESALPAIAASLEVLDRDAVAVVRLVCDGPEHEVPLLSAAELDLRWVHRREDDRTPLPAAVRAATLPEGRAHAFVHGEADEIREIRRHLLTERGLERAQMSCSPYWRRTMADEAWRKVKREYVAAMEADAV